jgi:hypothetical protein
MAKNDPVEVRIEKMATWAAGVQEQLDDLTAAMVVSTEEHADGIAFQLAELLEGRKDHQRDYLTALDTKSQLSIPSTLDDEIERIEAEAMLEVSCALDDDGKVLYKNDSMRKAAITIALDANEKYKALVAEKREQKLDLAQARAVLETLDREAKEYGRAVDILTARLNNLTARAGVRK